MHGSQMSLFLTQVEFCLSEILEVLEVGKKLFLDFQRLKIVDLRL